MLSKLPKKLPNIKANFVKKYCQALSKIQTMFCKLNESLNYGLVVKAKIWTVNLLINCQNSVIYGKMAVNYKKGLWNPIL